MTAPSSDGFFGAGAKTAKFENVGDTYTGEIDTIHEPDQQTKPNGDLVWADAAQTKPKWQMRVVIQTALREDDDDDGLRTLYIKGHMHYAVGIAIQQAKAKNLALGGKLTVTHTGTKPATVKGNHDVKEFAAVYEPPVSTSAGFLANGGGQQAPTTAAATAPADPVPATAGMTQAQWDGLPEPAKAALRAAAPAPAADTPPAGSAFTQEQWDAFDDATKTAIRQVNP